MHPRMALTPKENVLRTLRHNRPDRVPYAGDGSMVLVDHRGRKPPRSGLDAWGVKWAPLPESYVMGAGEPAESYPVAPAAASVAELLERSFPDPADPALFDGLLSGLDPDMCLVVGQHDQGPFDRFCSLLGMTEALLALRTEREASRAALDRIADYHVGIARGYLAAGVGAGWLADDYAGQDGPLLSPALWRRLILPGLARIIAVYADAGVPVFFHTCGRAEAFVPDLVAVGVTAFNLQSDLCDLAELKRRFGRRIAFYGGVPGHVLLTGTAEDVRRAAFAALDALWDDGGLILAPDQPLAYPAGNMAALAEAAQTWRWTQ